MVILLDLGAAEAMRRKDDIPSLGYLEERQDLYRAVAREVGASTVDASKPVEAVRAAIASAATPLLLELSGKEPAPAKKDSEQ